jgi:hypothetical protein
LFPSARAEEYVWLYILDMKGLCAMRHEQSDQTQTETSSAQPKKNTVTQTKPDEGGSNWQLKILMVIIGLGVLMLILKSLGIV